MSLRASELIGIEFAGMTSFFYPAVNHADRRNRVIGQKVLAKAAASIEFSRCPAVLSFLKIKGGQKVLVESA